MEFAIRDLRPDDIDRVEPLERACFSMPWTREQLLGQCRDERHEFLGAFDGDGRLLGYVGMLIVLDEGYISNVAVDASCRRMGVADALIGRLTDLSRERALAFVTLEVRAGNAPAIALYDKHGFVPVGRRKAYYDMPREDALLMTKFLEEGRGA